MTPGLRTQLIREELRIVRRLSCATEVGCSDLMRRPVFDDVHMHTDLLCSGTRTSHVLAFNLDGPS